MTRALALRRFDIPAFHREAARVLRPGGTLAVMWYDRGKSLFLTLTRTNIRTAQAVTAISIGVDVYVHHLPRTMFNFPSLSSTV